MDKEAKVGSATVSRQKKSQLLSPVQNKVSHRGKALVKLQHWLAEGQQ